MMLSPLQCSFFLSPGHLFAIALIPTSTFLSHHCGRWPRIEIPMTLQASSLPLPGGHCTACCVLSSHCHFHHFAALQNYVARAGIKRCNRFTLVYLLRQEVSYPSLASIASYTVDIVLLSTSIPVITINVAISSMT